MTPDVETTFGIVIPFNTLCGIEAFAFVEGRSQLRLVLEPKHGNSHGTAHGGLLCTLLDVAMSTAVRLGVGQSVVTVDMQTRFLRPGRGTLLAEGWVVKGGRSISFCEAEVRDASGELVASATGVFKLAGESPKA